MIFSGTECGQHITEEGEPLYQGCKIPLFPLDFYLRGANRLEKPWGTKLILQPLETCKIYTLTLDKKKRKSCLLFYFKSRTIGNESCSDIERSDPSQP